MYRSPIFKAGVLGVMSDDAGFKAGYPRVVHYNVKPSACRNYLGSDGRPILFIADIMSPEDRSVSEVPC